MSLLLFLMLLWLSCSPSHMAMVLENRPDSITGRRRVWQLLSLFCCCFCCVAVVVNVLLLLLLRSRCCRYVAVAAVFVVDVVIVIVGIISFAVVFSVTVYLSGEHARVCL